MIRAAIPFLFIAGLAGSPASAQLAFQQVGTGFNQPLFVTAAPGETNSNQIYVVEKGGTVRTLDTSSGVIGATPFLNLPGILGTGPGNLETDSEKGLLGMAFAPGFSNGNGQVYVNYTVDNSSATNSTGANTSGGDTRIDRFTVNNGVVDTLSRTLVMQFAQPNQSNHKGGWIGFGQDNLLYIGTGDGGASNDPNNVAQNLTSPLGKMLRISPNTSGPGFTVPASNPFAGNANTTTQTIFAYGLRNPFRNSFDRSTGALYIADVGQNTREEINYIAKGSAGGQNFGWRALEGNGDNPGVADPAPGNAVAPIIDYTHATNGGSASITGGYVYRGGNIMDRGVSLDGTYIYGDYVTGRIFSFRYDGTTITDFMERTDEMNSQTVLGANSLSSFGEDNLGRLYAVDIGGQVYRVVAAPVPEPATVGLIGAGFVVLGMWKRRQYGAGQ